MLSYSIVIRTLGTSGEMFREELQSIARQSVKPDKVLIYIAEGYAQPFDKIGEEEYVWVRKGMGAQRLLPYREISSDVIFFLDDDVLLAPDSAERMLKAMEEHAADCVAADTFRNHRMSAPQKLYAAVTNLVFPHRGSHWAFKVHANGSFSYNNNPREPFLWSQKFDGPAFMIRKNVYDALDYKSELWVDDLGFAFGDDWVISYKLYANGYKMGVLYDAGCVHQSAATSSGQYRKSNTRFYTRAKAQFIIWWRTIYSPATSNLKKVVAGLSFAVKTVWLFGVFLLMSIVRLSPRFLTQFVRGTIDGWRYVHTPAFESMSNFIVKEDDRTER